MSPGKPAQFEQRLPHHLGGAFDHPAATDREQSVADEGKLVGFEPISDVAAGVARRLDDASGKSPDFNGIAFPNTDVDQGNSLGLLARGHHAAPMALLELGDAGGVVGVVVRHQDMAEPPSSTLERRLDRTASGASMAAVEPLAGSCNSTP